jgi:hypothetical protein
MSLRTGIALTAGFIVVAAVPVTIGLVRTDGDADASETKATVTTVYRSYVTEDR